MRSLWVGAFVLSSAISLGVASCGTSDSGSGGGDSGASSGRASDGASGEGSGVTSTASAGSVGSTGGGTTGSGGASGSSGGSSGSSGASAGTSSGISGSSSGASSGGASGTSSGGSSGASSGSSSGSGGTPLGVVTNRYDNSRTGAQLAETALTPATVSAPGKFGLLFSLPVDGTIRAQPLYAQGISINGAAHNALFVATEHNTVYAFDADSALQTKPLWSVSLGPSALNAGAPWSCQDLIPETGISGTPVIDPASGTLYALAETNEGGTYHHKLHALDWTSGAERMGSPVEITPTQAGWSATRITSAA